MGDISTVSSFDSLVLPVLKQGQNKWCMMVKYDNLNAVVISIESPVPNIIEIINSIQSVASKCLTIIYYTYTFYVLFHAYLIIPQQQFILTSKGHTHLY